MELPALRPFARSQKTVNAFGGLNRTEGCGEQELAQAENMSAGRYPALCSREPRRLLATLAEPYGVYEKNGLLWVDGDTLYYNGAAMGRVEKSRKTFCGIGSRVLIFPDRLAFDTETQQLKPLGAVWQSVGQVYFTPARLDGSSYTVSYTGAAEPEQPQNGEYWLDTGGSADVLRVYSAASGLWAAVETVYTKIAAPGIDTAFEKMDAVHISGVSAAAVGQAADDLNTVQTIWDKGEGYITVTGLLARTAVQQPEQGEVRVERKIPELDYLTECDNRVWGVSSAGHEIFACKLGDPTNWYSYLGTAADSYTVSVGSDGPFTGAAACMGYVLLFKEGLVHKVYGSKPANYQVVTTACPGVKKGCAQSLALAGATLYYLSPQGVMAWDGGLPEPVGRKLGAAPLFAAVGGGTGGSYVLAARNAAGGWALARLETDRGLWQAENISAPVGMARYGDGLAALLENGQLWAMNSGIASGTEEPPVRWYAETGDLGSDMPHRKQLLRVDVRLTVAEGASAVLEAQYDSSGSWQSVGSMAAGGKRTAVLPVLARRCDHVRLRLSGCGAVTVHSLTRTFAKGSEL